MKKSTTFVAIILMLLISCKEQKSVKKSGLIPETKLTQILIDMHFIDGLVNSYNNNSEDKVYLSTKLYDSLIFEKYNVTDSLFKMSVEHYTLNSKIKDIYSVVLDTLNTRKAFLQQEEKRKVHVEKQKQ